MLTVPGHMSDNNARVGPEHRLIIQTPTVVGSSFRALHPDISLGNQTQEQVFAFKCGHIKGDVKGITPFLNPGAVNVGVVIVCNLSTDRPPDITLAGPLYLDDLRSHLGG